MIKRLNVIKLISSQLALLPGEGGGNEFNQNIPTFYHDLYSSFIHIYNICILTCVQRDSEFFSCVIIFMSLPEVQKLEKLYATGNSAPLICMIK